jgi:hypothetical protein
VEPQLLNCAARQRLHFFDHIVYNLCCNFVDRGSTCNSAAVLPVCSVGSTCFTRKLWWNKYPPVSYFAGPETDEHAIAALQAERLGRSEWSTCVCILTSPSLARSPSFLWHIVSQGVTNPGNTQNSNFASS